MAKVVSIDKARGSRNSKPLKKDDSDTFTPCSQDMTICGDCEGNRARNKCPRLREWLARRGR